MIRLALKSNLINTGKRQQFAELSRKFVMVNVDEPDEPKGDAIYAPDGYYFPRILFFGKYAFVVVLFHSLKIIMAYFYLKSLMSAVFPIRSTIMAESIQ